MKYLILFPLIFLVFISCESSTSQQSEETASQSTEKKEETRKPAYVDLDINEFKKMMDQQDVVILDVRTPEETAEGKIEGAIEIDISDPSYDEKIQALDKDKTYLVYCAAGSRSVTSCNKMADLGFTNLYNLLGGYEAWSEAQQ